MKSDPKSTIEAGEAILGIEFGSTRIKAVLIDPENNPLLREATLGKTNWSNGLWTYSVDAVWYGCRIAMQTPYERKKLIRYRNRVSGCNRCQCHDAWLYGIQ